jgi:four helix bundle protein
MGLSPQDVLPSFEGTLPLFWSGNMFDHEKLHVYQLQLEFIQWVTPLIDESQRRDAGKTAEVRRQLDRASLSVLLNIAEGNGRRQQQTRAKFFDDARGSTSESAACLDALVAKGVCQKERVQPGKEMLLRMCAMLTKLVDRFDRSSSSSSSSSKPRTSNRTKQQDGRSPPLGSSLR